MGGLGAVVGQIVLMRELILIFNGNEISLGSLLATWLLWTAAGSALASWTGLGRKRPRAAASALLCLEAAGLPWAIWALRCAKSYFSVVPGELVGPAPMLAASFICLSLFCAAAGALFVLSARLAETEEGMTARSAAGFAYLTEAAGSALGGVLASLLLVRFLSAFQIAALIGLLDLALAAALLFRLRRRQTALLAAAAALAAIPLLAWVAPQWEAAARARLWRGFAVVAERNSVYGNLTVTETSGGLSLPDAQPGAMRSLYENGSILANAPDPAAAEEAIHYALLEHASPRRVLLIGGGVGGAVAEALKHPSVERLDYVELDPALIDLARKFFPDETVAIDRDPRVHLHLLDGRRFLSEATEKFDAIVIDTPDPQTAQLNRFYTVEFFRLARAHLARGGLVAIQLHASEETLSPDLAAFLRSIRRTLGEVFPYQATIPGETIHFFGAAEPGVLTSDPRVLVARLHQRRIATQYVSQYFIPYRMSPDRMAQTTADLAPTAITPVNRDFAPVAYAFDVVLWSAQFRSGYANCFRAASDISLARVGGGLAIALLAIVILLAFLPGHARRRRAAAGGCVAATGFTLMALEIFLLLGFQALYGYVYAELAILTGLAMAGMAAGSWLAMQCGGKQIAWTQLALALSAPALLAAISLLANLRVASWLAADLLFPALAALAGALGGFQFTVAASSFVRDAAPRNGLGALYALDLAGGCAGALALSGFLIPIYGFWPTAWITAAVNAAALLLAMQANLRAKTNDNEHI